MKNTGPIELSPAGFENFMLNNTIAEDVRKEHFSKGVPITYGDPSITDGMVREYPNGKKEVINMDEKYNIIVVRVIE